MAKHNPFEDALRDQTIAGFEAGIPFTPQGILDGTPELIPSTPQTAPASTASSPGSTPVNAAPAPSTTQNLLNTAVQARDLLKQKLAGGEPTVGETTAPFASSTPFTDTTTTTPFDEEGARRSATRNQLRLHQAEIDATNQIFDQQLEEARLQGLGRLGSTRAIGARGGILGSSFGAAQKQAQIGANTAEQRGIEAERSAAIGSIMSRVRSAQTQEVADKRAARAGGAETLLANLAGAEQRRQDNIDLFAQDLIAQGFDVSDLSEEELQAFATEAGVTVDDLIAGAARAKAAQGPTETKTLKEGEQWVDRDGNVLATGGNKLVTLKEGDTIIDRDTQEVLFRAPKTFKPSAGKAGDDDLFTSKDLPGDIRSDLLDDIQAGQTVEQLLNLYPEVSLETIQDIQDQFAPEEEDGQNFFSKFASFFSE